MTINKNQTLNIQNESDLQKSIVRYLRSDPHWLFTNTPQGSMLSTYELRKEYIENGYTVGSPDLIILNSNTQFHYILIELKTPNGNGILSDNQIKFHKLIDKKVLLIVSNSYTEVVELLIKYKNNISINKEIIIKQIVKQPVKPPVKCLTCDKTITYKNNARHKKKCVKKIEPTI